jgi:DNA replication and repair protein RecF
MHLMHLQIRGFRNLTDTELQPGSGVNLITGENASGKTSLLESIYYLSHVRSFRSQHVTDLINSKMDYLELSARISTEQGGMPVGIRRSKNKLDVRMNCETVRRVVDIATQFPVLAIHPDSYKLIAGSPSQRRQYLDWGVFHVERGFFDGWRRYKRALSQRNAALKSKQDDMYCSMWNTELHDTATHIDTLRKTYLSDLKPYMTTLIEEFFPAQEVDIQYKRGWKEGLGLFELLTDELKKDRLKGFTQYGPHRADLVLQVNGLSAQNGISRGQQKLLIALLRLAQAKQFTESTGRLCALLYDDLAAELDGQHREKILNVLSKMRVQLFLTAIEPTQIDISRWHNKKMFHVEQGRVNPL